MQIQWYPGHMNKAFRQMKEDLKLIDLLIEICDARIPESSRNPQVASMAAGKERIILLNKADLADPSATNRWIDYFKKQGVQAMAICAPSKKTLKGLDGVIERAMEKKRERDKKRGILPRPVRAMVAGIPNSGKSTFINSYAGKAQAKTGNKPGVTKGKQWIRPNKRLELLDTPGVLWPKFEDDTVGLHLACVGSIRDEVFQINELVLQLLSIVFDLYPGALCDTYAIKEEETYPFLEEFARTRGCIRSGGELDIDRACLLLLNDYRGGKWGKLSLEWCKRIREDQNE